MTKATHINADAVRFGRVIQRLRLGQGWSIAELARRSGFNKNYLSLLEQGKNTPSLNMLLHLAEIFHVNASEMLREVEEGRREARARRASAMLAAAGMGVSARGDEAAPLTDVDPHVADHRDRDTE